VHKDAICPTCHRPLDLARICIACGAGFTLSVPQQRFFVGRGLELPKRCDHCRTEKKRASQSEKELANGNRQR
jgi:hypothetical protein